jgi:hypothetical protein
VEAEAGQHRQRAEGEQVVDDLQREPPELGQNRTSGVEVEHPVEHKV